MRSEGATMTHLRTGLLDNVVRIGRHTDRATLRVPKPRLDVVIGVHRRRVEWRLMGSVHVPLAVVAMDSGVLVCLNLVSSWSVALQLDRDTYTETTRDRRAKSSSRTTAVTVLFIALLWVAYETDVV